MVITPGFSPLGSMAHLSVQFTLVQPRKHENQLKKCPGKTIDIED